MACDNGGCPSALGEETQVLREEPVRGGGESTKLIKLISVPMKPLRATDVAEFNIFAENFLTRVNIAGLTGPQGTKLLQAYVKGYSNTLLKRYIEETPEREQKASAALNQIKSTIFPPTINYTGLAQIFSLEQHPDEPMGKYVERVSALTNAVLRERRYSLDVLSEAVHHVITFKSLPVFRSMLLNPAVSNYNAQELLDYAYTLDQRCKKESEVITAENLDTCIEKMRGEIISEVTRAMESLAVGISASYNLMEQKTKGCRPQRESAAEKSQNRRRVPEEKRTCYYCGLVGHLLSECRSRKRDMAMKKENHMEQRRRQLQKVKNVTTDGEEDVYSVAVGTRNRYDVRNQRAGATSKLSATSTMSTMSQKAESIA